MSSVGSPMSSPIAATQVVDQRPLAGVVAFVDVRSESLKENRGRVFEKQLEQLGAEVVPRFTNKVTHVVFKRGRPATRDKAVKRSIPLVSVLWVDSCKKANERVSEDKYPVTVDDNSPIVLGRMKRQISMQPKELEVAIQKTDNRLARRKSASKAALSSEFLFQPPPTLPPDSSEVLVEDSEHPDAVMTTVYDSGYEAVMSCSPRCSSSFTNSSTHLSFTPGMVPDTPPSKEATDNEISYPGLDPDEKERGSPSLMRLSRRLNFSPSPQKATTSTKRSASCGRGKAAGNHQAATTQRSRSVSKNPPKRQTTGDSNEKEAPTSAKQRRGSSRPRSNKAKSAKPSNSDDATAGATDAVVKKNLVGDVNSRPAATSGESTEMLSVGDELRQGEALATDCAVNAKRRPALVLSRSKANIIASAVNGRRSNPSSGAASSTQISEHNQLALCPAQKEMPPLSVADPFLFDSSEDEDDCLPAVFDVSADTSVPSSSSSTRAAIQTALKTFDVDVCLSNSQKSFQSSGACVPVLDEHKACNATKAVASDQNESVPEAEVVAVTKRRSSTVMRGTAAKRSRKSLRASASSSRRLSRAEKKLPVIVMTSLHAGERDTIQSVVLRLGGFRVGEEVDSSTTHIVSGAPRRTLSVLRALARGCWLLSMEWVLKSLEAGQWVAEEPYELSSSFPSAQLSRLRRLENPISYRPQLFTSHCPVCILSGTVPPQPQLEDLVKLCGGEVCHTLRKAAVCVAHEAKPSCGGCPLWVSEQWVLDTISQHKELRPEDYRLPSLPTSARQNHGNAKT